MPEYERISDTAARLGKSRETIRLWVKAGYFPGAERPPLDGSMWMIPTGAKPDFTAGKNKPAPRRTRRTAR